MKQKLKSRTVESHKEFKISLPGIFKHTPLAKLEEYISQLPDQKLIEEKKKNTLKQYPETSKDNLTRYVITSHKDEIHELRNKEWMGFHEQLKVIPTYIILQKASNIILNLDYDYYPNIPVEDDFRKLWSKSDDIQRDLEKFAIIDKTLQIMKTRPLK